MADTGDASDIAEHTPPMDAAAGWYAQEHMVERARTPKIVWFAAIVSIAWLAAAAALIWLIQGGQGFSALALTEWAAISAGVFAPLTMIWMIAYFLSRFDPRRGPETLARIEAAEARFEESAALVRRQVDGIDGLLTAVAARVDDLGAHLGGVGADLEGATNRALELTHTASGTLAEDRDRLDELIERLTERSEYAHERLASLGSIVPEISAQTSAIGQALDNHANASASRIDDLKARLLELEEQDRTLSTNALRRADDASQLLAHLDTTARDVEAQMAERGAELNGEIDQALARTAMALEQLRSGVGAQADALNAAIDQANVSLDETGQRAAHDVERRLTTLIERVEALTAGFIAQDERSAALFEHTGSAFDSFDQRLADTRSALDGLIENLEGRLIWLQGEAEAPGEPLSRHRDTADALANSIHTARAEIEQAMDSMNTRLPEVTGTSAAEVDRMRTEIAALHNDFDRLTESAASLSAPVTATREEIEDSVTAMDQARLALGRTADDVMHRLRQASDSLAATNELAEGTSLGAASQLIDALGRVREVANQASESVRATLSGVVDEAVAALGRASEQAIRDSTSAPLKAQIGEIEAVSTRSAEAANAAAERLSRSLVSVAETAAAVEARVKEADEHLDKAQKSDLSQQANLLIEALNSNAIDITKALSTEVTETAWKQYQSGDRSVFTRRASRLVDASDAKSIARHFEEEAEFRDAVRRYIHDFESMMRRIMKDRDGDAFSVALLSSDIGKLYVALAQSTERLRS